MGTDTANHFVPHELEERQTAYRHWCDTVSNPAKRSTEGLREIRADNGSAVAQYKVVELPSSKWAVMVRCQY